MSDPGARISWTGTNAPNGPASAGTGRTTRRDLGFSPSRRRVTNSRVEQLQGRLFVGRQVRMGRQQTLGPARFAGFQTADQFGRRMLERFIANISGLIASHGPILENAGRSAAHTLPRPPPDSKYPAPSLGPGEAADTDPRSRQGRSTRRLPSRFLCLQGSTSCLLPLPGAVTLTA